MLNALITIAFFILVWLAGHLPSIAIGGRFASLSMSTLVIMRDTWARVCARLALAEKRL